MSGYDVQLNRMSYFVDSLDISVYSSGSLLKKKDLYGWLNKNPPISMPPPAEPSFLMLWNSLCTVDLNVAQDNSMQVPGEKNSRNPLFLLCVEAHIVYDVLIRICCLHVVTVNPWGWNTCVYWGNTHKRPCLYWFLQTWLCPPTLQKKIHFKNGFATPLGTIQFNCIDFFFFFLTYQAMWSYWQKNHTCTQGGCSVIPQPCTSSSGAAGRQVPSIRAPWRLSRIHPFCNISGKYWHLIKYWPVK